ncbi:MAG: hypothetical protein ABSA72_04330 [Nitrososphaerales archaeon]|jgi:hypothetical protein
MQKNVRSLSTLTFAAVIMLCLVVRIAPTSATPTNSNGVYPPGLVPGPDPPLNPTALLQIGGDYTYTAAGTALRNTGSGVITVSFTGTVVAAYLIWGIINPDQTGLASASINGNAITGTFQSDDASPCWGGGNLWVYAADVTPYVTSGANTVSGFASGATDGGNPWSEYATPLDDGASLVVVTTGAISNNIYVYTGAYTEPASGNPLTSVFNHGAADATTATTTFFVLDGQLPSNYAEYNGAVIDSNAFPGSDPKTSTATWSYGSLSDTKTYSVPETLGATSDSASIGSNSGDCLTWAAQVISIPSTASVPPIGVPQPTNSVPEFAASPIMVAAIGAVLLALLVRSRQNLKIHPA